MYILPQDAQQLELLGFKRTRFNHDVQPFDIYYYEKKIFVIGGQILPEESIFAPDEILKKGIFLPSLNDLEFWLKDHGFSYEIESQPLKYCITACLHGICFKTKGGSLTQVFFNVIVDILESKITIKKEDNPPIFKIDSIE